VDLAAIDLVDIAGLRGLVALYELLGVVGVGCQLRSVPPLTCRLLTLFGHPGLLAAAGLLPTAEAGPTADGGEPPAREVQRSDGP
jgi:hypothetical protein